MSRESVRQAFKSAIQTVYSGHVESGRLRDLSKYPEYASVYLSSGSFDNTFSGRSTACEMIISYHKQNATDAELDAVIEAIHGAIASSSPVAEVAGNVMPQRFDYTDDSTDMAGISYTYNITF